MSKRPNQAAQKLVPPDLEKQDVQVKFLTTETAADTITQAAKIVGKRKSDFIREQVEPVAAKIVAEWRATQLRAAS